jgi:hypothetical protein
MKTRRGTTIAAAALLAAAAFAVQAAEPEMKPEVYTAVAMNMNAGPGPSTGRLTIRIKRWSTEEERAAWLRILAEKGSEKLVEALRKERKSIGNLNFTNTVAYDFKYARQYQLDGTRHIVLATDRPVTMGELQRNALSLDKGVTIVHLVLPPGAEAKGELLVGAELRLDAETRELTLEHLGTTPVRLTQVQAK